VHFIAEDYGMIRFPVGRLAPIELFPAAPRALGAATGTDMLVGRNVVGILEHLVLTDDTVDYVVVDTLRTGRETFAAIWEAWRDAYVDPLARHSSFSRDDAVAHIDEMISATRDPRRYATWFVPVVAGRVA
jgi:hypothetical protein